MNRKNEKSLNTENASIDLVVKREQSNDKNYLQVAAASDAHQKSFDKIVEERNEENSLSSISQSASAEPSKNSSFSSLQKQANKNKQPMHHKSSIIQQFIMPKCDESQVVEPRSAISSIVIVNNTKENQARLCSNS